MFAVRWGDHQEPLIHNEQFFCRIHKANLISFGIPPMEFVHEEDLMRFSSVDRLCVRNLSHLVQEWKTLPPENETQRFVVGTHLNIFPRLREILLARGVLTYSPHRGTLQPEHNGVSPNVKWIEGKRIRSDT